MANTFGQSKANETSAWQNNKEMNPQENSSVTDDIVGAMAKHGLSEDTKKDVIAILYSLKDKIIRV